jgi:hypothetical protein
MYPISVLHSSCHCKSFFVPKQASNPGSDMWLQKLLSFILLVVKSASACRARARGYSAVKPVDSILFLIPYP